MMKRTSGVVMKIIHQKSFVTYELIWSLYIVILVDFHNKVIEIESINQFYY